MSWRGKLWMLSVFACILSPLLLPERYAGFVALAIAPLVFFCVRRAGPHLDAADAAAARKRKQAKSAT